MENIQQKADFLQHKYTPLLAELDERAERKWGKMNVQQMIEHMADYVRIASGVTPVAVVTPEEQLPRMQGFLASEKPFRENTPNSLLPDEPAVVRHARKQEAIAELRQEIDHFFEVHKTDANRRTANPFFGVLDYDSQVQLLYKHATHHLRQFGVQHVW